jgi:hypothetical protein
MIVHKSVHLLILLAILATACTAPTPQPTATATPQPSPTHTPIPTATGIPAFHPPIRPDFKDGSGATYSSEQISLIKNDTFIDQEDNLKDWVAYWELAENAPFYPKSTDLNFLYLFDLNNPEEAIVLLQAGGEYKGATFYLPINTETGEFREEAPPVPDKPYDIAEGDGPLRVSGGEEGLTLADVDGELVRVNEQGEVIQIINKQGKWETLQRTEVMISNDGGLMRFNPKNGLYERLTPIKEFDPENFNIKFAPMYNEFNKGEPVNLDEPIWKLRKAEQIWRIYKEEEGGEFKWKTEDEFIRAMENYHKKHPNLEVIQAQSVDGENVVTLIYDKNLRRIMWGEEADGTLEFQDPSMYTKDTKIIWINLPSGTKPGLRFNDLDKNNNWYVFAVDEKDNATHVFVSFKAADKGEIEWSPLYQGIFSERYSPSFTAEYTYHDEESGLVIPIAIGITDDLPIKSLELTDLGVEVMGKMWLASCYYRYTEIMGNDVSMEEYGELVKQGKGQVEIWYSDEATSKNKPVDKLARTSKKTLIDPRSGPSITLTGRKDLPLVDTPMARYPWHNYFSANNQGRAIIVTELSSEALERSYQITVVEKQLYSPGFLYSFESFTYLLSGLSYWAKIKSSDYFTSSRFMGTRTPEELRVGIRYMDEYMASPEWRKAEETPFAKAVWKR